MALNQLDRLPILKGAGIAGVIALAFGLGGRALPDGSSLVFLFALIIFGGMALGGFIAGREQPAVALTAGAIAAAIASGVLQLFNLVLAAVRGSFGFSSVVTAAFLFLICTSMGSIGGYVAFRRDQVVES